jgi:Phosphoadenosine phosphosulfate reductase family
MLDTTMQWGNLHVGHVLFVVSVIVRINSFSRVIPHISYGIRSPFKRKNGSDQPTNNSLYGVRGGSSETSPPVPLRGFGGSSIEKTPDELQQEALELYSKLRSCNDGYMSAPLNSALDILSDALRLYGPHQLFASYNGGKDAEVVLHLLRAVFAKYSADKSTIVRPELIYFAVQDEFTEVLEHIVYSEKRFGLQLKRHSVGISQVKCI